MGIYLEFFGKSPLTGKCGPASAKPWTPTCKEKKGICQQSVPLSAEEENTVKEMWTDNLPHKTRARCPVEGCGFSEMRAPRSQEPQSGSKDAGY